MYRLLPGLSVASAGIALLLLTAAGCLPRAPTIAPAPSTAQEAGLLDRSGRPVTREAFLRRAAGTDYVLIGETHTNACDHRVQAKLIRWLAGNGTRAAVGLEMVPQSSQPALDRFNAGKIGTERLKQALRWDETWGHPFSLYLPVFKAAHASGYPLFGLNVERSVIRTVRSKGLQGLDPSERSKLPDRIIPPPEAQRDMLTREFEQHQELLGRGNATVQRRERFFLAQSVWDTVMAASASKIRAETGSTVIILAGNGHVEHGWGIPHRLGVLEPSAEVLSITGWRGLQQPDPERADLFFFCPLRHTSRLGFTLRLAKRGGLITEVREGSKAGLAGMRAGDLLVEAGGEPFRELMDLHRAAVRAHRAGQPLVLVLRRDGARKRIRMRIGGD